MSGESSAEVFLRDTSLRFDTQGIKVLHYDQATHLLLAVRRDRVSVYTIDRPHDPPQVLYQVSLKSDAS